MTRAKLTSKQILRKFINLAKKLRRIPRNLDLEENGITTSMYRHHFVNMAGLLRAAKETEPELFESLIDESVFTPERLEKLRGEVDKYRRFIVTSVVAGAPLHKGFHRALQNYAERHSAKILYIPIADPASRAGWSLPLELGADSIVHGDLEITPHLAVSNIKMSAKHIDPTAGVARLARNRSVVFGSPKQHMRMVPNRNGEYPHALMSSGAITKPMYDTERYMSQRTARLAELDHVVGAVVFELETSGQFHFRQVQADGRGAFIDLGVRYHADGTTSEVHPEYFILGDWHVGDTDPGVEDTTRHIAAALKPQHLVLHDFFDGKSISHHNEGKLITKARNVRTFPTLKSEIAECRSDLKTLLDMVPGKVYIVASNHDDFLGRYLNSSRWTGDYVNFEFVSALLPLVFDGENPLRAALRTLDPKLDLSRVVFLDVHDSLSPSGVELAAHGHLGPNGAKGSIRNLSEAYGSVIIGHSHSPGVYRSAYQVGTSTKLTLDYTAGPSSWMNTHCVLYPNGSRQLINIVDSKWRAEYNRRKGK